jgi:hypothetical protein
MEDFTLLFEIVQFATGLSLQEVKVDVALVIGQCALLAMTNGSCKNGHYPDEDAPMIIGSEGYRLVHQAQADGHIDGEEPEVARKPIEHTSPLGFLTGETSQLAIGTVVMVGPHQ